MITADQLKDIQERAEALHRYLDIDRKRVELEEEELRTQAPDFWDDPARAQEQMKKVKGIEKWIVGYKEVRQAADELQLAFDFYHDEMVTEEEVDEDYRKAITAIENLELMNMLRQRKTNGLRAEDKLGCRRNRKSRLGANADAYVHALGRIAWPSGYDKQPARGRRGWH